MLHSKSRNSLWLQSCTLAGTLLLATAISSAQQPQIESAPSAGATPTFTLHTGVDLVVVDVVVSGPNGHPVRGLKASDFKLDEDHTTQQIRNFQEHSATQPTHASAAPPLAPGLFTNNAVAASDGPANILLLDMLNTPLRDQAYARQQIQDYLNHAPAGTQIAIFGLSSKLTILQGFTTDPAVLKSALFKKNAARSSSLLDDSLGGGGGDGGGATAVSDSLGTLGDTPDIQEAVANARQFEAEGQSFRFELRAQITLDAINELARYLANIPGRKNLIWFSGSFPINILPDPSLNNGFGTMSGLEDELHETTNLLTRARVALYPVDARGLMNSGTFSATSNGNRYAHNPAAVGADEAKFDQQLAADNSTMLQAAQDTGGHAYLSTNALSDAVGKAISDGANYYTLTFSPTNKTQDGRYRKLEVTLDNKEYQLSYRRGYYAADPSTANREAAPAPAARDPATTVLNRSMVRGAPVPTQIQFTVRVRPATGASESILAPANELAQGTRAGAPFTRYAVDFAIDPRGFSFQQQGDRFLDVIRFVTYVYDADGNLVSRVGATLNADLTSAVHARFERQLLSYNQDVSVPQHGQYFLRIAVVDGNSDRVGAIELPVDSVKTLPPLTPSHP